MPIYEYTCGKCNTHLEVLQKISDKPLTRHAKCGGKLTKEWSQTSFQLKGSGWYVTDYAGRKQDAKEGKDAEGKEAKAESSSAKGESSSKADKAESSSSPDAAPSGDEKKKDGKKAPAATSSPGGSTAAPARGRD